MDASLRTAEGMGRDRVSNASGPSTSKTTRTNRAGCSGVGS